MINKRNLILVLLIILINFVMVFPKPKTLKREQIQKKYKWDISDIYKNWNEWEKDKKRFTKKLNKINNFKGTLSKKVNNLYKVLKYREDLNKLSYKLYWYVKLHLDTNQRNQKYNQKYGNILQLFNKFNQNFTWFEPELLEIRKQKIEKWIENNKKLKPYDFYLEKLFRHQKHVLSEEKEKLLSYFSPVLQGIDSLYSKLSNSDMEYPEIELSNGKKIILNSGNYSEILKNDNLKQTDRRKAYIKYNNLYQDNKYTYAELLNTVIKKNWARAKARNYESSLKSNLFWNKIPVDVYKNLISVVKNNNEVFKRYYKLKKKIIKNRKNLKEYWAYDTSLRFTDLNKKYPYEKAKKWIIKSSKMMGSDYNKKIKKALNNRWIDVFRNEGKAKGAYNIGVYGVHPYLLLNYNDEMDDMFTVAHELGHAIHSLYSIENQPFSKSNASIFVAEVASTFNEKLLLNYLLKKIKDPKERIAILRQAIGQITGTFLFQTYLADFELQIHERIENNKTITLKYLKNLDKKLDQKYFGNFPREYKDYSRFTWSYIGHLYDRPFYVYQYATCFASSAKLYKDITTGNEKVRKEAKRKYLNLLKSGGNDYPMSQLKKAGVDLTKKEPFIAIINQFEVLVDRLEKEVKKLDKIK